MTNIETTGKPSGDTNPTNQLEKKSKKGNPSWKKGVGGNPNGRPKGSKNKLTILREAVLANAENHLLENWEEIVQTTVALAKAGDTTCLKLLWDKVIPSKRAAEDKKGIEDKLNITLVVKGMDITEDSTIDAEFVEVVDGD